MTTGEKHPLVVVIPIQLGASATGVTTSTAMRVPFAGTVTAVNYSALANVTGANSNSRTLRLTNHKQDGSGSTVVAELPVLLGVNLTAFDEKVVPLSATAADRVVSAGDILEQVSVPVGAGLAGPGGTMYVTIERL
jgi:hypothetical protein